MYFEVFKHGNLIIRGKHILNTISLDNELMLAPSTTLVTTRNTTVAKTIHAFQKELFVKSIFVALKSA